MGLVIEPSQPIIFNKTDGEIDDPLFIEGSDVTDLLGLTKYEPALPRNTQAKGGLPFGIPKTDEERWQNLRDLDALYGSVCDVTLKRDGSSATYYCVLPGHWPGVEEITVGLTSRSLELKCGTDDQGNQFSSKWHEAERRYNILEKLRNYCVAEGVSLALRGEITGEGIQGFAHNPHASGPTDFALFSVYNITDKKYEEKGDRYYYLIVGALLGTPRVELLERDVELTPELIKKYDSEQKEVEGKPFEGVVIKHREGSFKIINKWYDADKE
jgi:RNA ligase (TIGR02306 family)